MAQVGLIGIGLVGAAMAERLLAAGHSVVGYDIDAAANARLARLGGSARESAAAVVGECDAVLLSLPTSGDVLRVLDACAGVVRAKQLFVDTTTGSPQDAIRAAEVCAGRGATYVEATILGSSELVRAAAALVILGGDEAERSRAEAIVGNFAATVAHVGPLGAASRMKLAVNLVLGLNRAALAEGLAFAEAIGLDPRRTLDVLRAGAAYSRVMDAKGEKMLARDFTPEARLAQHHKDVRLIAAEAAQFGLTLPLTEAHARLLEAAERAGHAASDNCAILAAYGRS